MERMIRMAKRIEIINRYQRGGLSCVDAARILGISERHFRRLRNDYGEHGEESLLDKRTIQPSKRRASCEEVEQVLSLYRERYFGLNVQHFYDYLCKEPDFKRSYTWVKEALHTSGMRPKTKGKGTHRKKRERKPMRGMMLHQDGSTHEWLINQHKLDLIVTLDDATSEIYSMFLCAQESTHSTLQGLHETISAKGLFSSFYTDRGSHYFHTPEVGGKVDKNNPTQVGRALKALNIMHIPAYSPQARGRMERVFLTLQNRLPHDLALAGIRDVNDANDWFKSTYIRAHNARFAQPPEEAQDAFIPYIGDLSEALCVQEERVVKADNTVSYKRMSLQIPQDKHRYHYVRCTVVVRQYLDDTFALFHGQRCLARYNRFGDLQEERLEKAA